MAVTINVKADFGRVQSLLNGSIRQIPFATARALTATAKDVQRAEEREIREVFDQPVPFTQRAVGITSATKQRLQAVVVLKRKQAAYLKKQIEGGGRRRKPFEAQLAKEQGQQVASAVPGAGATLNQYGNLTKAQVARLGRQAKGRKQGVFVPKPGDKLPPGVYQRQPDGKVKPVLVFTRRPAQYRKRFDFYGVARKTVRTAWQRNFATSFAQAVRTAR